MPITSLHPTVTPIRGVTLPLPVSVIETITPVIAAEMLLQDKGNRPVVEMNIKALSDSIRKGRFVLNGDSIRFDRNGRLIDGRHRLTMSVRTGESFRTFVTRGLDPECMDSIDSGSIRTPAAVLAMEGTKNANFMAPAIKVLTNFLRGVGFRHRVARQDITQFPKLDPDALYFEEVVSRTKSVQRVIPVSIVATVLFLSTKDGKYGEKIEAFIAGVSTGVNLDAGDPRYVLREWAGILRDKEKGRDGSIRGEIAFSAVAIAWNAFVAGKAIKKITPCDPLDVKTVEIAGYNI